MAFKLMHISGGIPRNVLCVIASGLFFWLGWPPNAMVFFLFIFLVPLFQIQATRMFQWWMYIFGALFLYNVSTTFWLYHTIPKGAFFVHLANSLIFTIPFLCYWVIASVTFRMLANVFFILCWISLEFLHLNWQLAYPVLNLGNGLAKFPMLFQWYEYTGVLGGTLWILGINFLVSEILYGRKFGGPLTAITALAVVLPTAVSILIFKNYKEPSDTFFVSAIQTSLDCRNEKYSSEVDWVIRRHIELTEFYDSADVILWPETAVTNSGLIDQFEFNSSLTQIRDSLALSGSVLLSGAIIYRDHGLNVRYQPEKLFYHSPLNTYLSVHNSVLAFHDQSPIVVLRSKERLVPFEESSPYPIFFSWVRNIVGSLGGFKFTPLSEGIRIVPVNGFKTTSIICYEILFGQDVADLARTGADAFFLHLNEGWYKSDVGASQFLYFTSLRAVESRRSFGRSSNFGFSALINQKGEIIKRVSSIEDSGRVDGQLHFNRILTFYAINGDLVGIVSIFCFIILVSLLVGFLVYKKCFYERRAAFRTTNR